MCNVCVYICVYIYIYIHMYILCTSEDTGPMFGKGDLAGSVPVPVNDSALLRRRKPSRIETFRAPDQGVESSFCCWIQWQL